MVVSEALLIRQISKASSSFEANYILSRNVVATFSEQLGRRMLEYVLKSR